MQNPAQPVDGNLDKAAVERKRKHPPRQPHSGTTDSLAGSKQQTISELFSTSQQKPGSKDINVLALSPNSKRIKLDSGDPYSDELSQTSEPHKDQPLSPDKMYSFPTKNTNGKDVIDLTKSLSPSPVRKNGVRNNMASLNPHMGAKKLAVKNFRTQAKSDSNQYFSQVWGRLDAALDVIYNNGPMTFSLEELYKGVENLCKQGHAEKLCAKWEEKTRQYMGNGLKEPLITKGGAKNVDILRSTLAAWAAWNKQLKTLHWIFCYMDRAYLLQKGRSLQDTAITLFREEIFDDDRLTPKLTHGACELIEADRANDDLEQSTFRDAIHMFHELGVYTKEFEPLMLSNSQTFIMQWSEQAISEQSLPNYVRASIQLMNKEMNRCDMFGLDASTRRDLLTLLEDHLIAKKESSLVNQDSLADLLEDNDIESLKSLYSLLWKRGLAEKLRPGFEKWIEDTGTAIIFDDKEQELMVIKLLTLKKQLDVVWRISFQKNEVLGHALREAFELFINKTKKSGSTWDTDNSKPGEMIAKYVDSLLRGGAKAIPAAVSDVSKKQIVMNDDYGADEIAIDEDREVNSQLDQVLDLFRFVQGKAVFEAFYKNHLARRLLMGRSASADAERSMLTRLKTECGSGFTQNLEQMFKDVELGREEMAAYKSITSSRNEKVSIDLSVSILSASAWPSYKDVPIAIPGEIKQAHDSFERYYVSKHSNRKLSWKHALAHCQLKASFPNGNKELVVSSFQAIVLLLFNNLGQDEKLSYEYIKAETGLPQAELDRTLQSLACARIRPLTKQPKSRDISPTDQFSVNVTFSHEKYRVKINQIQLKETKEENKETHERVAADRNYETQAAIVRIMKSRKTIAHAELVAEVITATKSRGVLGMADIKRNIDRLIEKDYMEREDGGKYSYIA